MYRISILMISLSFHLQISLLEFYHSIHYLHYIILFTNLSHSKTKSLDLNTPSPCAAHKSLTSVPSSIHPGIIINNHINIIACPYKAPTEALALPNPPCSTNSESSSKTHSTAQSPQWRTQYTNSSEIAPSNKTICFVKCKKHP